MVNVVVQYPLPGGGFRCQGFSGDTLSGSVFIVVDGEDERDQATAADVGIALVHQIGSLSGLTLLANMPCGGSATPYHCHAIGAPDCRKIYVRVSESGGVATDFNANAWDDIWAHSIRKDWIAVQALPARDATGSDPWVRVSARFPLNSRLTECNACRWERHASEVVPAVLVHAGLTTPDNRVFISYSRGETTALADQLFGALTERGFDVFLDRCSVPVGVRFQERLMQDLDDKAVAVLLHSPSVAERKSFWIEHELARIKQYRLGLVVLNLPSPTNEHMAIRPDINPDAVYTVGALQGDHTLTDATLGEVLAIVHAAHAQGLARRRWELIYSLGAELRAAGKTFQVLPGGELACGARPVIVGASPRPPELTDYASLSARHGLGDSRPGACLTPAPLVLLERQEAIRWLEGVSRVTHLDQESVRAFVVHQVQ